MAARFSPLLTARGIQKAYGFPLLLIASQASSSCCSVPGPAANLRRLLVVRKAGMPTVAMGELLPATF